MYSIEEEAPKAWTIRLNSEHFIYKAHFPGHPVTPGICIAQIIGELIERHINKQLVLHNVKSLKFTGIIDPVATPVITVAAGNIETVETGNIEMTNAGTSEDDALVKANGTITAPDGKVLTKYSLEFLTKS